MSYTPSWTVAPGDTPSAAKWDELGANDDYLYAIVNALDKVRLDQQVDVSLSNNTVTYIAFGTSSETYKTASGMHSTTVNNTRITAVTTGYYHVCAAIRMVQTSVSGGFFQLTIIKNGTTAVGTVMLPSVASSQCSPYISVSGDVQLTAGDYIEVYAYENAGSSGTAQANPGSSFFSAARLA